MGVLLVALQRRVGRHGPAPGEVAVGVRPADVVEPGQLGVHRLGDATVWTHSIDEPVGTTLLAGPVVGRHDDDRVLELPGALQEVDEPPQVLVRVMEHGRVGRLQAGEQPLLVGRVVVPCLHPCVARRQFGAGGHQADAALVGQTILAGGVPPFGEHRCVVVDEVPGRLMGGVAGAGGQPQQPWRGGPPGAVIGQIRDCVVDQVGSQVVPGLVGAGGGGVGVVAHHLG